MERAGTIMTGRNGIVDAMKATGGFPPASGSLPRTRDVGAHAHAEIRPVDTAAVLAHTHIGTHTHIPLLSREGGLPP
eukprot:10342825-Karenia_brevis.AAC.1